MARNEKIDALVQTVRDVNHEVRPKISNKPGGDPPGNPLHEAIIELRDHEQGVSRLIRSLTIADLTAREEVGELIEARSSANIGTRQALAEFGTAREAILSILSQLGDEEWEEQRETEEGTISITKVIDDLVESDKTHLKKIREQAAAV